MSLEADDGPRRPRAAETKPAGGILARLGPGLITGAADDDPSGIATYSQAGAQFGFGMLWTMALTYPLMAAVQLVSARIGRVTGAGLAANLAAVLPRPAVLGLLALLFCANTINIGANLAAMGAASHLALGGNGHIYTLAFAVVSLGLQLFVPYRRYASYLKWLTFVLLAYVALLMVVHVDWKAALAGLLIPRVALDGDSLTMIVAIFGTTISPYLLFWQSSQEVEELRQHRRERPLGAAPEQAPVQLARIRLDTCVGMAVSNLVAIAIMIGTAATLNAKGPTHITSAADAAAALKPVAGNGAFVLFCVGIVGTGLLSIPVLAGSAAYALGECQGWKCGLEHKPWEAVPFYGIIVAATVVGIAVDFSPLDPMVALFWSAVVNGIVAVPVLAAMMWLAGRKDRMQGFIPPPVTRALGWATTLVMAAAAIAMAVL
ncbi:NRAMP (natural resistance-associated macrophage protein) metal ion transporters [Pseudoxanthobacter soli DSM 19599]|uniref:NRAMP (Natural resistance-associated macrophage protein) metal ion transporters n=1 Tax=Pseudoxanthobacter soli DSM 19599 TaxID=1123029 RepID=A0A1M7ZPX1_9HYPH|nr:divalent metal cation transporter [Pseudoxanthobacter soli]SHO66852.1 NRAMP (natural resistance-associated macrophage protein) metal ion transporters [Pseudoxanthobacter soli DSM 19599]